MALMSWLAEPELKGLDVEGPERIQSHSRIIKRKKMLRGVFEDFYRTCMACDSRYFGDTAGMRVELGAGVSFFNQNYPDVKITDIKPAPHLDDVIDAQQMKFSPASVRALFGLNFFHHLPNPEIFFKELLRVAPPGGGCVLIEPYHGVFASLLYKRLFTTESFDKTAPYWASESRGAMLGANQALSYIVFVRDREKFQELFPELEILHISALDNYLKYILSGGLNFRQLVPSPLAWLVTLIEKLLYPLKNIFALHHVIVLRRKSPKSESK